MKIEYLSIDLETYSSIDIGKCGVYKYAESPDSEVLLFACSVNGAPVRVYDVAQGEYVPDEILASLSDDSVTKWAFNASFERVFLSVWLQRKHPQHFSSYSIDGDTTGHYLDPSSWRCSMVWSAYLGLPLSLEGTGAGLGDARSVLKSSDYELMQMLYDDVPDTLSQLIRTAFIPRLGCKLVVSDFSAIEARVLYHLAGEKWRIKVFEEGKDIYCASASQMFHVPVKKHGQNAQLRQKGKIAELALGYGGAVGALRAMGALEMGLAEEELQPLVDAWRTSNPNIVQFWWDVDRAVKDAVRMRTATETHGIKFTYQSGMLFIGLPSGRRLCYVKPKIGENRFGGESVTYEGVGVNKKWERIESYDPKFVENIVQAVSRDILCHAMRTLSHCFIVGHVHDELIIECGIGASLDAVCEQMGRTPPWIPSLSLHADGFEAQFYKKD